MMNLLKLAALHKHRCIADAVRVVIAAAILKPDEEAETITRFGPNFAFFGQHGSLVPRISVWYSLLYVVVEGYPDLKQQFEPIDAALQREKHLDLLSLFRNAAFRYQEDSMSEKEALPRGIGLRLYNRAKQ